MDSDQKTHRRNERPSLARSRKGRNLIKRLRKSNPLLLSDKELLILRDDRKERFEAQAREWLETLNATDRKRRDAMNLRTDSIVWTPSDSDAGLAAHVAKRHDAESGEIGSKFLPTIDDQALRRFMLVGEIRILEDLAEQLRRKPDIDKLQFMRSAQTIRTGQPVGVDIIVAAAAGMTTLTVSNALQGVAVNKLVLVRAKDIPHLTTQDVTCIGRITVYDDGRVRAGMATCHPGVHMPRDRAVKDKLALAVTAERMAQDAGKHGIDPASLRAAPTSAKAVRKARRAKFRTLRDFAARRLPMPASQPPHVPRRSKTRIPAPA